VDGAWQSDASDYSINRRWFDRTPHEFVLINYCGIVLTKLSILLYSSLFPMWRFGWFSESGRWEACSPWASSSYATTRDSASNNDDHSRRPATAAMLVAATMAVAVVASAR
jgi:hypothetical protein